MKKNYLIPIVMLLILFSSLPSVLAADPLEAVAIKKLQQAVIKALPTETQMTRISVLELEGDKGTILNAITSAITEKTSYKVIERKDLDKILDEQGVQLRDVMDEKTRIQHGKIKGVQGLLMGKVLEMGSGFMSYSIRLHLKLDDVEKGEIVFSKDFSVTAVSPVRTWLIWGVIGLVVLIIIMIFFKRRRVVVIEKTIQKDVRERIDLAKEVQKAQAGLSQAQGKLVEQGKTDEAVMIKEAGRELLYLREQIENAPRGNADMRSKKEFEAVLEFDQKMQATLEGLTRTAERICDLVSDGNTNYLSKEVDHLRRDIKSAEREFKGRRF